MGEGAGRDIPGSRDQRPNASRPQTRAMTPSETENKDSSDFCDLNWKTQSEFWAAGPKIKQSSRFVFATLSKDCQRAAPFCLQAILFHTADSCVNSPSVLSLLLAATKPVAVSPSVFLLPVYMITPLLLNTS